MRKWIMALSLLTSLSIANEAPTPTSEIEPGQRFPNTRLVIDPYYSPYMGAEDIYTGFEVLSRTEDHFLPITRNGKRELLPCLVRLVDQSAWDTLGRYMEVWQHEFFGHGYRIRSLGKTKVAVSGYANDFHSGYTAFSFDPSSLSTSEMLSIDLAGLEAEDIMTRTIASKWVQNGEINSRFVGLYINSALSSWNYAEGTAQMYMPTDEDTAGNDISGYVFWINELYPQTSELTPRKVADHLSLNFLDPFIYYGIYAEIKYILFGDQGPIPMFNFDVGKTNLKFLPGLRARLTPYGIENSLIGYFLINGNPVNLDVRWGEIADFTFGGLHVNAPFLIKFDDVSSVGFEVDIWNQPDFETAPSILDFVEGGVTTPKPSKSQFGGAVLVNLNAALNDKEKLYGYLKVGYKSKGYFAGYMLDAGFLARAGVAMKF